jgi:hypothetical protein
VRNPDGKKITLFPLFNKEGEEGKLFFIFLPSFSKGVVGGGF